MGLESLESGFFGAFCDTKCISIACWEHIKPENTLQWHTLIINTSRGLVFTMEEFTFTQLTPFMPDWYQTQLEQTIDHPATPNGLLLKSGTTSIMSTPYVKLSGNIKLLQTLSTLLKLNPTYNPWSLQPNLTMKPISFMPRVCQLKQDLQLYQITIKKPNLFLHPCILTTPLLYCQWQSHPLQQLFPLGLRPHTTYYPLPPSSYHIHLWIGHLLSPSVHWPNQRHWPFLSSSNTVPLPTTSCIHLMPLPIKHPLRMAHSFHHSNPQIRWQSSHC